MKKIIAIVLTLCCVILCFTGCMGKQDSSYVDENGIKVIEEDVTGLEYNSFTQFRALDVNGKEYNQDVFKGKKLTMINIWATFCRPCINEMPDLQKLSQDYADKDFQIIGIVSDVIHENGYYNKILLNDALEILETTGVTYLNLLPSYSLDTIKLESVYAVPETIFVDENGNVIDRSYVGSRSYEDWQSIIDSIMAEM